MKIAIGLYFFMFIAFFDLHAQYPILTPFAVSLGAAPAFIGWMMGIYALTHLPGNLIAGHGVDKYGSKRYVVFSLISAGIVLLLQAHVTAPWQLLVLRSISGFVLAFLSPACLALLASLSRDAVTQGKLMAGHGVTHTLASVLSPAVGAFLVKLAGFSLTFQSLGWLLISAGLLAWFTIRGKAVEMQLEVSRANAAAADNSSLLPGVPLVYYLLPLGVACSQGILFFELPLHDGGSSEGILHTGIYFSILSLGSLVTLGMLFLHRVSPYLRALGGVLLLALCFYGLTMPERIPMPVVLFVMGMSKGIIFPAISSLFIEVSGGERMGSVFSFQSIAMSLGSFIGPIVAGQLHLTFSPYFLAFVVLMLLLITLPANRRLPKQPIPVD
ncbi:MFS transporter [Paenibacillus yonginensis]|uniref:MFS transporter n=1 Tax=Paenibacillus yonginensis TaxID=1462996 RepID=A0A1B1N2J6_9BACL|nr:MFS transporter [Paenibacillus yonginensis]ANS75657.1 MFS transporter [Paenibacillus yonginensis]